MHIMTAVYEYEMQWNKDMANKDTFEIRVNRQLQHYAEYDSENFIEPKAWDNIECKIHTTSVT